MFIRQKQFSKYIMEDGVEDKTERFLTQARKLCGETVKTCKYVLQKSFWLTMDLAFSDHRFHELVIHERQ